MFDKEKGSQVHKVDLFWNEILHEKESWSKVIGSFWSFELEDYFQELRILLCSNNYLFSPIV